MKCNLVRSSQNAKIARFEVSEETKIKNYVPKRKSRIFFYEITIFESIKNVTILRQLGVIIKSQQSENHKKMSKPRNIRSTLGMNLSLSHKV